MKRTARTSILAFAVPLLMAALTPSIASAQPIPSPPNEQMDNGNAAIQGSPCELAVNTVMDSIEASTNVEEGTFSCEGAGVTITATTAEGAREFLGNPGNGAVEDITGVAGEQLAQVQDRLGVAPDSGVASRAASDAPNTCFPRNGGYSTYTDSQYQAHANVSICYGRFITRLTIPVEIVWSDWLRYRIDQNLTNRSNQLLTFTNSSTSTRYIDVELRWNIRNTLPLEDDPLIRTGSFERFGWTASSSPVYVTYTLPVDGQETFHATQDRTVIHDYVTGVTVTSAINARMPDFDCSGNPSDSCTFT